MQYEELMKKCIMLARQSEGNTSPNPLVGCVILDKNGKEISTGFHKKYGENHAERDALLKLKNGEEKDGTLIVNLEPCSHFGKTPPCADLIVERGLKKVVIGMRDVNPIVTGNGIKKLQAAGIEVIENILEDECKRLNEVFIKNMQEHKTFIAIKTATTLDGKIATSNGSSKWITSEQARNEVKNIRNRYDAIMTTSSTIIADNPTMEHRKKIILDRELKTDLDAKIYQSGEIYLFYAENKRPPIHQNIKFIPTPIKDEKLNLDFILKKLFDLKIYSVLIESGGVFNGNALEFADKIYHFIAPKITSDNTSRSCFNSRQMTDINNCYNFHITQIDRFGEDILLTYYPIAK